MNCEDDFEDWKPLLKVIMEYRHLESLCDYQQKAIERLQMKIKALEFELDLSKRKKYKNSRLGNHL